MKVSGGIEDESGGKEGKCREDLRGGMMGWRVLKDLNYGWSVRGGGGKVWERVWRYGRHRKIFLLAGKSGQISNFGWNG